MHARTGVRPFTAIVALALGLLAPGVARAQLTISSTPSSGPTWTVTAVPGGKWHVELTTTITSQPTTFLVRGTAADKIEQCLVFANVPQSVMVEIRGMSAGTAITSVDLIDKGASTSTVILQDCRTSGNVGQIFVNTISNMNIGGNLTGGLTLLQRQGGGESTLINGSVGGRILGDVACDYGAIFGLTASAGFGQNGAPIQIRTKNNIVRLTGAEIYADISTFSNGGIGVTGKIETTVGPFKGSLATAALRSTGTGEPGVITVAGNLDADIAIINEVKNENGGLPVINVGGSFLAGRTLLIGTSLYAGAEIRVNGANGMKGQVIINGNDWAGTWSGAVRVNGSTLGPIPDYSATSGGIGGGSVGQVPFHLHGTDSWPARGQIVGSNLSPRQTSPIRVRFYGPITWNPGGTLPVILERRSIGSSGAWTDVSSCVFVGPEPGATPSANVIAVYPIVPLPGGFVYRVRPVRTGPQALVCDLGLAVNPAVADPTTDYSFTVTGGCLGDADASGGVNFNDITTVLANWGSSGGGSACAGALGDADASGTVNFNDITTVLANWGTTCP